MLAAVAEWLDYQNSVRPFSGSGEIPFESVPHDLTSLGCSIGKSSSLLVLNGQIGKTPSSKFQAPEKPQTPKSKGGVGSAFRGPGWCWPLHTFGDTRFGAWDLELFWSLELGAWSLELLASRSPTENVAMTRFWPSEGPGETM
jgi:hypothetical protein